MSSRCLIPLWLNLLKSSGNRVFPRKTGNQQRRMEIAVFLFTSFLWGAACDLPYMVLIGGFSYLFLEYPILTVFVHFAIEAQYSVSPVSQSSTYARNLQLINVILIRLRWLVRKSVLYGRTSHILTATWLDLQCVVSVLTIQKSEWSVWHHRRNRVTWLSRYGRFDCIHSYFVASNLNSKENDISAGNRKDSETPHLSELEKGI